MFDNLVEPEFQAKLDWIAAFVREECEPLDYLFPEHGDPYDVHNKTSRAIIKPLQDQVRAQGLWGCHLGPELGGPGFGQVKLALMNEILGHGYMRYNNVRVPLDAMLGQIGGGFAVAQARLGGGWVYPALRWPMGPPKYTRYRWRKPSSRGLPRHLVCSQPITFPLASKP